MRLDKSWIYGGGYSHALAFVGPSVGDQRVGGSGNLLHDPLAGICLRIHTDRALVEIYAVKVRPAERSGDVASRWLELDYIRAQVRQDAACGRPGDQIGDLEDAHTGQRRRIGGFRAGRHRAVGGWR